VVLVIPVQRLSVVVSGAIAQLKDALLVHLDIPHVHVTELDTLLVLLHGILIIKLGALVESNYALLELLDNHHVCVMEWDM
jgi:hypothetical protein